MIEGIVSPRPSCMMDFEMALREGEKQLLGQGITTMYHSLSLYKDDVFGVREVRKAANVTRLAKLIAGLHGRSHLIRHRFHARYEIDNVACMGLVRELIAGGLVQELSIMDHTPGQGQYRDLAIYRKQISGYKKNPLTEEEWQAVLRMHREKEKPSLEELGGLVRLALAHGIPVSSHDDDTAEKVELGAQYGRGHQRIPSHHGGRTAGKAPGYAYGGGRAQRTDGR